MGGWDGAGYGVATRVKNLRLRTFDLRLTSHCLTEDVQAGSDTPDFREHAAAQLSSQCSGENDRAYMNSSKADLLLVHSGNNYGCLLIVPEICVAVSFCNT